MPGLNKRPAAYVPPAQRRVLEALSKADLMEIAWDLALIMTGEADRADPEDVLRVIRDSHSALRFNGYQGSVKLPGAN